MTEVIRGTTTGLCFIDDATMLSYTRFKKLFAKLLKRYPDGKIKNNFRAKKHRTKYK